MSVYKRIRGGLYVAIAASTLFGCRVNSPLTGMEPDFYRIIHSTQPELLKQKVYVIDSGDSLQLVIPTSDQRRFFQSSAYRSWTFQRSEIDIDVFTLPFKIRPARAPLPPQLNSNFNAAVYVGRRFDLYNYHWKPITPTFSVRQLQSRGFGYGLFMGIGSVTINDFSTRTPVGIDYEGVVVNAGIASLYDARIFNIGFALGVDHLMDSNRRQWLYQQKPWFGVLFGLNLN